MKNNLDDVNGWLHHRIPDVYMETVEAAENEETEPDKTGDTGVLCLHGGKQPKRLLENFQHNYGQKGTIKRKTDKQRLL